MSSDTKIKVCHLTSVHAPNDGRIFYKECTSLAKAGYDVTLVVAGAEDEVCNEVKIVGVKKASSRFGRIFHTTNNVYKKALEIDANIYHLHDPELLPIGLKLKKKGKIVIFDSHEDYVSNIKEKAYLNPIVARVMSYAYSIYEKNALKRLDAIISVTPHLTNRLKQINPNTIQVTNYKIVKQKNTNADSKNRENTIAFVGPIRSQWSVKEIVEILDNEMILNLAGSSDEEYLEELEKMNKWNRVKFFGKVKPEKVEEIYKSSSVGFALLKYSLAVGVNIGTLGNTKIFEIMGAGIPVICTDFILWKEIIEKYECGICVNPRKPEEIKKALRFLLKNPNEAKRMGKNGSRAVEKEFNWASQEKNLLELYTLLSKKVLEKK